MSLNYFGGPDCNLRKLESCGGSHSNWRWLNYHDRNSNFHRSDYCRSLDGNLTRLDCLASPDNNPMRSNYWGGPDSNLKWVDYAPNHDLRKLEYGGLDDNL